MSKKLDIVFMGTPGFAVGVLDLLNKKGHKIKAVVTAPDKPAGRGRKILFSDVKQYALDNDIPVLQPEKLKSDDFLAQLKEINADLFIVVAFRMLPKLVWEMPEYGTFNLHASLLPDYRGAAPINHAIINGEKKTGVTTFFINENIDTGNIIMQKECDILPEDNAGTLHDKLMNIGSELVEETIKQIELGNINPKPQRVHNKKIHPAPKLSKEYCRINWNNSGNTIVNHIRGLSPYPAAWTMLNDEKSSTCKVFKTRFESGTHNLSVGTLLSNNKTFTKIATSDGFIFLEELQMAGKKRMNIKSLLNGFKFQDSIIID